MQPFWFRERIRSLVSRSMGAKKRPAKSEPLSPKAPTTEVGAGEEDQAEASSAGALPKASGSGGTQLTARAWEKANLQEMSLEEKIALVKQEHPEDEDSQAKALQKVLTKEENSKIWGQHQTYLKRNPEDARALENASKTEKGLAKSLWFLRKSAGTFHHVQQSLEKEKEMVAKEKWLSHKQIHDRFEDWELDMHLASGRVVWRNDPLTKGAYEYQDRGDVSVTTKVKKRKVLAQGQEYNPGEEDEQAFWQEYNTDTGVMLMDAESLAKGEGKGKGKDKGKIQSKGKGKGRGRGRGPLPLPDADPQDPPDPPAEPTLEEQ